MNEKDMNLGATVENEKWIEVENGISVEHKHLGKSKELQKYFWQASMAKVIQSTTTDPTF